MKDPKKIPESTPDIDEVIKEVLNLQSYGDEVLRPIYQIFELSTNSSKSNGSHLEKAADLLEYAKRDLKASEVLRDIEDHHNSIYHLQQAVEKVAKAYAVSARLMSYVDMPSKVGHHSQDIFFGSLENPVVRCLVDFYQQIGRLSPINNYKEEKMKIKQAYDEIKNWDKETIGEFLEFPYQFADNFAKKGATKRAVDAIDQFQEKTQLLTTQDLEKIKQDFTNTFNDDLLFVPMGLFVLGIVTSPHSNKPRYPGELIYKEGSGIVESQDKISLLAKEIIEKLSYHISRKKNSVD